MIFPDCKMIETWLASIKIHFEWLLTAKTEKVVKNLGRFGFFIFWNKNRMSLFRCTCLTWLQLNPGYEVCKKIHLKTSYFHFKGWKIQIFPDFWQLFLFLLSKVIQTGFFCLQVIFQSSCNQGKSFFNHLAIRENNFEWLLKAKTEKVVKILQRFGFFIL